MLSFSIDVAKLLIIFIKQIFLGFFLLKPSVFKFYINMEPQSLRCCGSIHYSN